jgi:hypothetical protein
MKKTEKNSPSKEEIVQMSRSRQLFGLKNLTTEISFPKNITFWEQLMCAGYNPRFRRLEAVVNVNQTTGYNGNLCSRGSTEYVRFFVDFHDGSGFQNMGYTSFKVADISNAPPGPQHPISYLAYLFIDDSKYKKFLDCDHAVIPKMRAVLSWNSIPSLDPNDVPHYGNRVDADIQLARKFKLFPFELAEVFKVPNLVKYLDPQIEIDLKPSESATAETILKKNKDAGVPDERTFYSFIGAKINSTADFSQAASAFDIKTIDKLKIDLSKFLDIFNNLEGKKANTTYEELTCLGLNSATDSLGAVIHVKKSTGFNGDLCTAGSMEHVAFWADWNNNGTFDEYLGTVSVNVHDIQNIPADGLYYNVLLPIDVSRRLKSCATPQIVRIRAVLSWESLPSTTNPNQLNFWGNYKDALVQLRPKLRPGSGIHSAIYLVGNADRTLIHPTQFLYNYQSGAPSINNNRPWGGNISFHGIIDRNGFGGVIKYRLLYKKLSEPDSAFQPVSTSETFILDDLNTPAPSFADPQTDADGWFIYKQNPAIGLYNVYNYLATWNAGAKTDGPYTIRFVHTDEFGAEVIADQFTIMVCNKPMTISPTANAAVDTAFDLDLVIDGGDCHSYTPGAPMINGHLRAVHPYFADWSLDLQPTSHTHGALPAPVSRSYSVLGDTGDANGTWSLDTSPLDPCGYTVSIGAHTRVILNSWTGFPYYAPKAVGFAKLA